MINKRIAAFILIILCQLLFAQSDAVRKTHTVGYQFSDKEIEFLDTLQYRTFLYFWQEANPANGLVRDRSQSWSPASTASTGFGVVAWAIGAEHRWISRTDAAKRTLALLEFLNNSAQSTDATATGYKGFYYHFLDMNTGRREWNCELSSIDTAWLIAGLRFAAEYYNHKSPVEKKIRKLVDIITKRVDWNWIALHNEKYDNLISLAWDEKNGFSDHVWGTDGYNEGQYVYIIAAGSGLREPQKAYSNWLKRYIWSETYPGLGHGK